VSGRLGVVARQLAGRDSQPGQLAVKDAARLGAWFPVHQPQTTLGHIADAADSVSKFRP
jgi:hypothetical protein